MSIAIRLGFAFPLLHLIEGMHQAGSVLKTPRVINVMIN